MYVFLLGVVSLLRAERYSQALILPPASRPFPAPGNAAVAARPASAFLSMRKHRYGRPVLCGSCSFFPYRGHFASYGCIYFNASWSISNSSMYLQSEASGCEKGFVNCFLKVPLITWAAWQLAVQPNSLWNSQNKSYN